MTADNTRFLVPSEPGGFPNLASRFPAAMTRQLPNDRLKAYGCKPLLAETFCDPEFFTGTIYATAGWQGLGAGWIRNVCGTLFSGMAVTYIPDCFHLSERLSDALKAIFPGDAERKPIFETRKAMLKDSRAPEVMAALRPHADRHEAVGRYLKYMEANIGRMNYKPCRERGIHIGSGVVEGACRSLVGTRLKRPGSC